MIVRLAGIYVAAVIGAGFASGQEIVQFFVRYGATAFWGIGIATIILIVGAERAVYLCRLEGITDYEEFLATIDRRNRRALDVAYGIFLLASVGIMLSGSGALFAEFSSANLGKLMTTLVLFLIVLRGSDFVLLLSSYLVGLLLLITVGVGVMAISGGVILPQTSSGAEGLLAGLLYGCYNFGFAVAVLAGVATRPAHGRDSKRGVVLGGVVLGALLLVMVVALTSGGPAIIEEEIPMLALAEDQGKWQGIAYGSVLYLAMLTTAIANALALCTRIFSKTTLSWVQCVIIVVTLGYLISFVGFVPLIKTAYPLFGFFGTFILYQLLRKTR